MFVDLRLFNSGILLLPFLDVNKQNDCMIQTLFIDVFYRFRRDSIKFAFERNRRRHALTVVINSYSGDFISRHLNRILFLKTLLEIIRTNTGVCYVSYKRSVYLISC